MASAIFQQMVEASGKGSDWEIGSAGTWAFEGMAVASGSVQVMGERGLDISDHRAKNITGELLSSFDLILTMEKGHKEALKAEFPEYAERIYMLSEMAGYSYDIRDPVRGPISEFESTALEINKLLEQGMEKIVSLTKQDRTSHE
jgi:protein-tyrosine-phosphatase